MIKPAIFLDRDGIIVKSVNNEAPTNLKDLQLIPKIIPVIKRAQSLGYLVIVVSNQPDIALGVVNEKTKDQMEKRFVKLLKIKNISLNAIYYCHHHPKGINPKYTKVCDCQKPKPGMLLQAIKKFNIGPSASFMVGDRASDIKAGKSAKVKTILFDPDKTQKKYLGFHKIKPDFNIISLEQITQIIDKKMAFILAAGIGSRMMPLTKKTPKPLLRINKIPMIEYALKLLEFHKFRKIGINTSYLKDDLKKYLEKRANLECKIVEEKELTGSAGGVRAIGKILKPNQPFLVMSCDMLINFDLSKIYKFHIENEAVATICCYFRLKSKLNLKKSGLILFDKKTRKVLKFAERPKDKKIISQWVNSSVYIFNPEVIKLTPQKPIADIASDLIPKLLKLKKSVYAYPINRKKFYQLGVDTPERIKIAQGDIKSGKFLPTT